MQKNFRLNVTNEFDINEMAISPLHIDPLWIVGLAVLILIVLALLIILLTWIFEPHARLYQFNFKYSQELKNSLKIWQPIVADSFETHRDVKTFANIARVICELSEKSTENRVRLLVALTALVAIENPKVTEQSNFELLYHHLIKLLIQRLIKLLQYLKNSINVQRKKEVLVEINNILSEIIKIMELRQDELDDNRWKQFCEQYLETAKFVEFPQNS